MRKRFLITLLTLFLIGAISFLAIFLAKGYRYNSKTGEVAGTGIISITSTPDQASVFLDGHLTTATNANVSSLPPKSYEVRIIKEGFIPWEKKVEVKAGLVSQIKATLWPAIPTIYPLTFNGVVATTLSTDSQRLAFIVPGEADQSEGAFLPSGRKSGIWVWEMSSSPISFNFGPEPHRVASLIPGEDYSKAILKFSPDSNQVLVVLPDRSLLLDENKFNDILRDITAILQPTLDSWEKDQKAKELASLNTIKDSNLRQEASNSASLKWSLDETKLLEGDGKGNYQSVDLVDKQKFNLPKAASVSWLPDSRHLVLVEDLGKQQVNQTFPLSKISIMELDSSNKDEIYVGNLDPNNVYAWPDLSKLVFISSVPTQTGNKPNLFGINLK